MLVLVLVAHSHGTALALHEATLFALIGADGPAPNDADGIREAVAIVQTGRLPPH